MFMEIKGMQKELNNGPSDRNHEVSSTIYGSTLYNRLFCEEFYTTRIIKWDKLAHIILKTICT